MWEKLSGGAVKKGDHAMVERGGNGGMERFEGYLGVKTNITC